METISSSTSNNTRRLSLLLIFFTILLLLSFMLSSSSSSSSSEKSSQQQQQQKLPEKQRSSSTSPPLLRGAILFLYGGRWNEYFIKTALPRLDKYALSSFPYPMLIFHEDISEKEKKRIRNAVPLGNAAFLQQQQQKQQNNNNKDVKKNSGDYNSIVQFDNVVKIWKHLPHNISEHQLKDWIKLSGWHGRGYRIMCRFWFGLVWMRKSLDDFDYYWRMDTDSVLARPLTIDPFVLVFKQRKCVYGYNELTGDDHRVVVGLFDTFKKFMKTDSLVAEKLSEKEKQECIHFVTHRHHHNSLTLNNNNNNDNDEKFWAPMFFNNFEMGTLKLKRSELYQRFFQFVDENEPYGIFRNRWGDAPLHTLGILVAQHCSIRKSNQKFCHVSSSEIHQLHDVPFYYLIFVEYFGGSVVKLVAFLVVIVVIVSLLVTGFCFFVLNKRT